MSSLTEFLLARIAEDEESARASIPTGGRRAGKTFWQRRVAECAAKRRIMARHTRTLAGHWSGRGNCEGCGFHGDIGLAVTDDTTYCPELIDLVQVYVDHPGFDPAWSLTPPVRE